MKTKVINPMVVVEFRAEVCAFVNDDNDLVIATTDFFGNDDSITVDRGSIRALGLRLIDIANDEGV